MNKKGELTRFNAPFAKLFYKLARTPLGGFLAGWWVSILSIAIPASRLRETATLFAFFHPRPSYPFHVLLIPKRKIKEMSDISVDDAVLLIDVFKVVESIIEEYDLKKCGYRLIVNGGQFQEIPQLHFHLIAEQYRLLGDV